MGIPWDPTRYAKDGGAPRIRSVFLMSERLEDGLIDNAVDDVLIVACCCMPGAVRGFLLRRTGAFIFSGG